LLLFFCHLGLLLFLVNSPNVWVILCLCHACLGHINTCLVFEFIT
jgi:hypothetical protein